MKEVKMDWNKRSPLPMLVKSKKVLQSITDNATLFKTPPVDLKEFGAAIDRAELAYNGRENGKLARLEYTNSFINLDGFLRKLAPYVSTLANGDAVIIGKAGFEPTSTEKKSVAIPGTAIAPVLNTLGNGKLKIKTKKVTDAKSYVHVVFLGQVSNITVEGSFLKIAPSTDPVIVISSGKLTEEINNLPIGATVTVVVLAQNAAGIGAPSPEISKLIN